MIRVDDPKWEDVHELRASMARDGLITRSKDGGYRLRTYGWQCLVALSVIAESDDVTEYPGLSRALYRAKEVLDADTD
jgi:hypothetical protein